MMKKDRMRFPGIGPPKQDYISVFSFAIRACSATRSEDSRQTGDAGGVSSTVATINIVCPHHGADKLLCCVVQLVRGFGTAEHPEIAWIVFSNGLFECRDNAVHRFIPCSWTMRTVIAHQRLGKAGF
jgi:hypothetical protein